MNLLKTASRIPRNNTYQVDNSNEDERNHLIGSSKSSRSRSPSPKRKTQEVIDLENKIKQLEDKVKRYKDKITELKYRPGGVGYEKAKERFQMGVRKQLAIPTSPKPKTRKSLKKGKSL
jgi:hypothetical protein